MNSADAVSLCAHSVCDGCLVAEQRALETGDVVECVCGVRHEPRQGLRGASDARSPVPTPRSPQTAPRRPLPRLVYVAPDGDAPTPAPTALERAGAAARALRPDDPELVRVRRLLADLRPDCPDPCEPPATAEASTSSYAPTIRDPSAAWGGLPRGMLSAGASEAMDHALGLRAVAEVLAAVDALPAPAPSTLRWLRDRATLSAGLRGLFVDAGVWAGATGDDLGARRDAAYSLGRRLVLRAADAWDSRRGA